MRLKEKLKKLKKGKRKGQRKIRQKGRISKKERQIYLWWLKGKKES